RFLSNLLQKSDYLLKNRDMHVLYIDTVNEPVKVRIDTVNDTISGPEKHTLIELIKQNQRITAIEISQHLKLSLSTVRRRIKNLKAQGLLERIGSDKTGYWKILNN